MKRLGVKLLALGLATLFISLATIALWLTVYQGSKDLTFFLLGVENAYIQSIIIISISIIGIVLLSFVNRKIKFTKALKTIFKL